MSLYSKWDEIAYQIDNQKEYEEFWGEYLPKEAKFYEYLLENPNKIVEDQIENLAKLFEVDELTVIGFIDGINSSLQTEIDMDSLDKDSVVKLAIDFEKLFYNMLDAKAEWLYELPQWESILSAEKRKEIKKEYNKSKIYINENPIGRNDPCPCGSGKKYKKCCGKDQ